MNSLFFKSASVLLNIAALAVASSTLSAQAETITQPAAQTTKTLLPQISSQASAALKSDATTTATDKGFDTLASLNSALKSLSEKDASTVPPLDPTPLTSASALKNELTTSPKLEPVLTTSESEVAQVNITPGRTTTSGPSYVGIAGNIGFNGDSRLGSSSFAVIGKVGLTSNLSVRPAILLGENTAILIPATYDFQPTTVNEENSINIAPYAGGGVAISTGDNGRVGFLLSGGVDVPLSSKFTATAGLNIGFLRKTEVGLLIGVGYNFTTTPGR